ncbi:MAG: N-acetylmuramoyl-L-alanine amidase [Prevotellaceae bacterium]|jgi:N-acetylmuramoyl-L-alanine amidase|nr:N-acetylmuramoyl-L-alanine amidase [Prevotellaceae bacterium]
MKIRFGSLFAFFLLWVSVPIFAQNTQGVQLRTVVIDSGHGGKDPGSVAPGGKTLEKHIALSVALKFGKLIENAYPNVKVLYTRKTDIFLSLASRADFANKNHADLFISIHVNSNDKSAPAGSETYVMGKDNSESSLAVSKKENSVIVFEDDYKTTYQGFDPTNPESYIIFNLLQNAHFEQSVQFAEKVQKAFGKSPITTNRGVKQAGFLVLWRSSMPAVLVELGFISNTADRTVLTSDDGQNKMATALFNAFKEYQSGVDKLPSPISSVKEESKPVQKTDSIEAPPTPPSPPTPPTPNTSTETFSVQILAISRLLQTNAPEFKGYTDIRHKKEGTLYKYSTGSFATKEEAQTYCNKVRKDYPQAFVVKQ